MNKPLREHYEVITDLGTSYRIFDYAEDLDKYVEYLEGHLNEIYYGNK